MPTLRRERHRVERAALLVLERLPDSQVIQRAVRMVDVAPGDDRAIGADDARAGERRGRALEELLAQRVGARRAAAALVDEHRPVGHRRVELGQRRQAQLGQHPRGAGAHRGDELRPRHVAPARGEQRQDLGDVRGQLQLRHVIAGPVGEADEVRVALDQARHHGAAAQVDDASRRGRRGVVAHLDEAPVPDRHRVHDAVRGRPSCGSCRSRRRGAARSMPLRPASRRAARLARPAAAARRRRPWQRRPEKVAARQIRGLFLSLVSSLIDSSLP